MVISPASTRNRAASIIESFRCAGGAVVFACAVAIATSGHAATTPLPKSYAAPCAKSEEFASAQRALVQGRRDIAAKRYPAASRTLRQAAEKLFLYMMGRVNAAGQITLDGTGQHLLLAKWREQRGDFKTSIYIGQTRLADTLHDCRHESRDISDKLRKMSAR
jgi:hypothetical protein